METVYLDTHIVLWLFKNELARFNQKTLELMEESDLYVSPMVKMELKFLQEIGRTPYSPEEILANLQRTIGLQVDNASFSDVADHSIAINWTRDPFDRLICAHAALYNTIVITKDKNILEHYEHARW